MLPYRHMVRFISELICYHGVVVTTSDGQQSRLKRINNGVPQWSVLSHLLFKCYIADLPEINSKKYGYSDDIALVKVHQDWNTNEDTLTRDMTIISLWLKQWLLKLIGVKTVSSTFHLNNQEAQWELNVNISGRRHACHIIPTTLEWSLTEHWHTVITWLRTEARSWHEPHWFASLLAQAGEPVNRHWESPQLHSCMHHLNIVQLCGAEAPTLVSWMSASILPFAQYQGCCALLWSISSKSWVRSLHQLWGGKLRLWC